MNILNINFSDTWGGASLAGYRLHKKFIESGVHSKCLVGHKKTNDPLVFEILPDNKMIHVLDRAIFKFFHHISFPNTYYLSHHYVKKSPLVNEWADIILLRNVHGDYISERILPYLSKKIPVVWRLPDMWALTGHCAYSYDCIRWKTGCGRCPDLKSYYPLKFDTTSYLWKRKKNIVMNSNLHLVSPSNWLYNFVKASPIYEGKPVYRIPTGVDEEIFKPINRESLLKKYSLSKGKRIILFGSQNVDDQRKGGHLIKEIVTKLKKKVKQDLLVLTYGANGIDELNIGVELKHFGTVNDDYILNDIYNLSDIYILPTLADNLPNTLVEAIAAGLPAVVFDTGGCKDAMLNGENGYVCEQNDTLNMVEKAAEILNNEELRRLFSHNSLELFKNKFTMNIQANAYMRLFSEILQ